MRATWTFRSGLVGASPAEPPAEQYDRLVAGLSDWAPEARIPILSTAPDGLIPVRIWSRPPPTRLGIGRVIVVGDAAHAMEPNLGQGACQALEDSAALTAIARRVSPDRILPMLEQLRLARVKAVMRAAGFRSRIVAQPSNRIAAFLGRLALSLTPASAIKQALRTVHRAPDYEGLSQNLVESWPVRRARHH